MVIDGHINLGKNLFGPEADYGLYSKKALELKISGAIVSPTMTQRIPLANEGFETSCLWAYDGKKTFRIILERENNKSEIINPENPYRRCNEFYLARIKELSSQELKLYFAPKIHPILSNKGELDGLIEDDRVVAIKINGIASFAGPKNMPQWAIDISKEYNKPFIIHTDFDLQNKNTLGYLRNLNNAGDWIRWSIEKNVRCYFKHGLRLSKTAASLLNQNHLVGIGPDFLLNVEQDRLEQNGDYLTNLFRLIPSSFLSYDSDFPWNSLKRDDWNILEWDVLKKIETNCSSETFDQITEKNIQRFFELH